MKINTESTVSMGTGKSKVSFGTIHLTTAESIDELHQLGFTDEDIIRKFYKQRMIECQASVRLKAEGKITFKDAANACIKAGLLTPVQCFELTDKEVIAKAMELQPSKYDKDSIHEFLK